MEVRQVIEGLPVYLLALLNQYQYKVVLSKLMVDYYPELRGKLLTPSQGGWDSQKRKIKYFDNVKGSHDFEGRVIVYPEYFVELETGELAKNQIMSCQWTLYHEIGHFIDRLPSYQGFYKFSETTGFKKVYYQDLENMPRTEIEQLDYMMNHSDKSLMEIFADTFSALFAVDDSKAEQQLYRFPRLALYLQNHILNPLDLGHADEQRLHVLYASCGQPGGQILPQLLQYLQKLCGMGCPLKKASL